MEKEQTKEKQAKKKKARTGKIKLSPSQVPTRKKKKVIITERTVLPKIVKRSVATMKIEETQVKNAEMQKKKKGTIPKRKKDQQTGARKKQRKN